METAKPTLHFKHEHYEVQIEAQNQRKLTLTVIDNASRTEYFARDIELQNIGTNTLIKALEKSKQEIKVQFVEKVSTDISFLEVKVSVESAFLKPVQEIISLKKNREVSEMEVVKKAMDFLHKKIKELKNSKDKNKAATYYGGQLDTKSFNGASYETIASVKLPKGKYLLTFNYLAKATNSWMYLYLNEGGSIFPNAGFYSPNNTHFIPHTVRKVHHVTNEFQDVRFTTSSASSYPVTIRNAIITAKRLNEQ